MVSGNGRARAAPSKTLGVRKFLPYNLCAAHRTSHVRFSHWRPASTYCLTTVDCIVTKRVHEYCEMSCGSVPLCIACCLQWRSAKLNTERATWPVRITRTAAFRHGQPRVFILKLWPRGPGTQPCVSPPARSVATQCPCVGNSERHGVTKTP